MSLIFIILILIGICFSVAISNYTFSYAQKHKPSNNKNNAPKNKYHTAINLSSTKLKTVATNVALIPTIKILSPYKGQKVSVTNNKLISLSLALHHMTDQRIAEFQYF